MGLAKNRVRPFLDEDIVIDVLRNHADYDRYNTPRYNGSRKRHLVEMRALYFFVIHNFTGLSLASIGALFVDKKGKPKDHATVLWAVKNFISVYALYNPKIRQLYEIVLHKVNDHLTMEGFPISQNEARMTKRAALHYIQHQRKIIFKLLDRVKNYPDKVNKE